MNLRVEHYPQLLELVKKDFNLEIASSEIATHQDLKESLSKLIQYLIDNDFERLLSGLYRIDVSEEKVNRAIASRDDVAEKITQLIIDRELQKVVTRKKYN